MKVPKRAATIGVDYPAALPVIAPYPAPAGYAFALILFLGRGWGRGGRATAKPTDSRRTISATCKFLESNLGLVTYFFNDHDYKSPKYLECRSY